MLRRVAEKNGNINVGWNESQRTCGGECRDLGRTE